VVLIGALFWWAIFAGQFDDTNRAGESILLDDDDPGGPGKERPASREKGD
jgi:cbb3-type cytochrome oxidase maturation protein